MHIPRFMIAGTSSGSGKTFITAGILRLLGMRGIRTAAFKCGPDFIDPMFHTRALGTDSRNLDTFFTGNKRTRMLMAKNSSGKDIAVIEGVMGYYDGAGINTPAAGSSDLAAVTDTPVILTVPAKGMGRSVIPLIKGFIDYQAETGSKPQGGSFTAYQPETAAKPLIKGIILNRISDHIYPVLKAMIEGELHVPVVGYVPELKGSFPGSRHLGLIMPDEVPGIQKKLDGIAAILEKALDMNRILRIAGEAPDIPDSEIENTREEIMRELFTYRDSPENFTFRDAVSGFPSSEKAQLHEHYVPAGGRLRIGLARDEAFCFFYRDNLELLTEAGAELVPFSPIHDSRLPDGLDGLLLHGGYPELHAGALSENTGMLEDIRNAILSGTPVQAECGGFLYLHSSLADAEGHEWKLAGVFPEKAFFTGRLQRFGYCELSGGKVWGRNAGRIRTHEFHYYESENPGDDFLAEKPFTKRSWRCVRSSDTVYAGFPHLYYYSDLLIPAAFMDACRRCHSRG